MGGIFCVPILIDVLAIILFVDIQPASAYVDPGTGSILMQVVLGGAAGLAVLGRLGWQRLRRSLRRLGRDASPQRQADVPRVQPRP